MKKFYLLFLLIIVIVSCKKQSELSKEFNCNSTELKNLKPYLDFKNNFKLHIPTNWKTNKYYSETQSEIFTADTTKQLTETYILNTSYALGTVNFDSDFYQKTDSIIIQNNFKKTKYGTTTFMKLPTFWYIVEGEKNGFPYHQFNIIAKKSEMAYFSASVEIYGDLKVDERICESISILEKIEFLQ
jgi:hypothetical protein